MSGAADLAGSVDVSLTPGDAVGLFTILSAAGGVTDNGLTLGTITPFANPLTSLELLFPNANDVVLGFTLDSSAGNFNPNQTNVLNNLNAINAGGVGGLGPVLTSLLACQV